MTYNREQSECLKYSNQHAEKRNVDMLKDSKETQLAITNAWRKRPADERNYYGGLSHRSAFATWPANLTARAWGGFCIAGAGLTG